MTNVAPENYPSVAVVVPVYNVAPYLHDCLNSLLNQTYKNFTIFAIDDGSTDESGEILESYLRKVSNLYVIHQQNGGVSVARNNALDKIKSIGTFNYISFVDSDDKVHPEFLSSLVRNAINHQADICICGYYEFNNEGHIRKKGTDREESALSQNDFVEFIFSLKKWRDHSGSGGMTPMKLFRSEILSDVRFPDDRSIVEDELFCLSGCVKANKIYFFPDRLYGYRQRFGSAVNDPTFFSMQLNGRMKCINVAETISHSAKQIVAAAMTSTIVHLCMNQCIPSRNVFDNYRSLILESADKGYIQNKTIRRFVLFCDHPLLAKAYLIYRSVLNNVFTLKRNKKY